ncbi:Protein ABHD16A [Portunus trituberculatus]|uniref:Protein ABHD16A n=1 Tax=Portunus trituberculatus TaxID=210409 RepID=A0A5B7INL8_PORTR|nr:Protein ABHD16A [Portunus trituberculatus]
MRRIKEQENNEKNKNKKKLDQGSPYPGQEQNAVDAVMQFAIHSAGFREEDILIYGWSIGGYSSTWAAMNYPQVCLPSAVCCLCTLLG